MSHYKLKNFVPVPDEIIEKYGGTAGLVYGRIWRYTNGGDHDCTASTQRIADDLKLSRPTVQKYLKTLIDGKEIIDKTPDRRNAPHILNITKQLTLTMAFEYERGDKKLSTPGVKNFDTRCKESLHEDTIKDTSKDIKDSSPQKKKRRQPSEKDKTRKLLEEHFCKITKIDAPSTNNDAERKAAGKRWWMPLRRIAALADWKADYACNLITRAVHMLDDKSLTISAPQSILTTVEGLIGKDRRDGSNNRKEKIISESNVAARLAAERK